MPLGPTGSEVKAEMTKRYGAKKAGHVFYGKMNKDAKFKRAMHKGAPTRKMSARR